MTRTRPLTPLLLALAALFLAACAGKDLTGIPAEERFAAIDAEVRYLEGEHPWTELGGFGHKGHEEVRKELSQFRLDFPFSKWAVEAELRTADSYYAQGLYIEAESSYGGFRKSHPSHPKADFSHFRQALCWWGQAPRETFSWLFGDEISINRDMTAVLTSYQMLREFLAAHPASEFVGEAQKKLYEIAGLLARHEILIGEFYRRAGKLAAAEGRFATVRERFPVSAYYGAASCLLGEVLAKEGRTQQARLALESVQSLSADRFPDHPEFHPIRDAWLFFSTAAFVKPPTGEVYWKSRAGRKLASLSGTPAAPAPEAAPEDKTTAPEADKVEPQTN